MEADMQAGTDARAAEAIAGAIRVDEGAVRSHATGVLDFWHASQHMWALAGALFGEGTKEARAWVEPLLHQLRHGGDAGALATLVDLSDLMHDLDEGRRAVRQPRAGNRPPQRGGKGLRGRAQTLDRRAHVRLERALPKAGPRRRSHRRQRCRHAPAGHDTRHAAQACTGMNLSGRSLIASRSDNGVARASVASARSEQFSDSKMS